MSDQSSSTEQMSNWASGLLEYGNLPDSQADIETVAAQEYVEGGPTQDQQGGATNPLDVENPLYSGLYQPFDTAEEGYAATLATLKGNDPAYYAALQAGGDNPAADVSGLGAGTWDTGHAGGEEGYAGSVASDIAEMFGGQPPTVTDASGNPSSTAASTGSGGSGGVTVPPTGKYDFFTEAMIQLDGVMHPKLKASVITSLGVGAIGPDLNMIMARGLFATAFGAVGLLVLFKTSSGGKISGAALPSLVAGLVAGPEAAALTGMSKLGVRKPAAAGAGAAAGVSPNTVLSQQRLAFQQQTAQQKLQLSAAKNASQAQLGQQRLAQSAAAQTQRTQTAHKKTLAQRYAARQRVAAAQTRAQPRTSTIHHQTTRQSTITHYSAKNPAPSDPGDS